MGDHGHVPIGQRFKIAQILWLAFLGSIGCHALVIALIGMQAAPVRPIDLTVRILLWAVGLGSMIVGPMLLDRLYPRPQPAADRSLGGWMITRLIIRLALIEMGAVVGLVIFFLTMSPTDFAGLGGIAFVMLLASAPSRVEWENQARLAGLHWDLRG